MKRDVQRTVVVDTSCRRSQATLLPNVSAIGKYEFEVEVHAAGSEHLYELCCFRHRLGHPYVIVETNGVMLQPSNPWQHGDIRCDLFQPGNCSSGCV